MFITRNQTDRHSPQLSEGGDFQIPVDAEVETKQYCVVYDSCTADTNNKDSESRPILLAELYPQNTQPIRWGYSCSSSLPFLTLFWHILPSPGPVYKCAKMLAELTSRKSILILKGGYESFSALYPYLKSIQIFYSPRVSVDCLATVRSDGSAEPDRV